MYNDLLGVFPDTGERLDGVDREGNNMLHYSKCIVFMVYRNYKLGRQSMMWIRKMVLSR